MIDELRSFVAVAATGNFSQVARDQSVAVSSVTRQIDGLEAHFGTKLFRRSPRSVSLTDAGTRLLASARKIIEEIDEARDHLAELQADPRGLLTVTAPATFGRHHVMPAAMRFLQQYPQIELDLHLSDEWLDLSTQRVDVAIRIGALPDSDLVAVRLAPLRRLVCASPEYLARAGQPDSPEALLQHNCLTVASPPMPHGWWCFPGVRRGTALPVRGSLRSNDTEALLQAALQGVGIVHLASWLVGGELASGRLVQLFPQAPRPSGPGTAQINAVRMPGRSHAAKAQLFIAHLRQAFGDPPYWDVALPTEGPPA